MPEDDESRDPLEANIRHALFCCFQSQDEVTARNYLFHRQSEGLPITNAIRDTLPYFLGADSEEAVLLATEKRTKVMKYFAKQELIRCYCEGKQQRCKECRLTQAIRRAPIAHTELI